MKALYEPTGAAAEYAPLAVNLYKGCAHSCSYCYAPACLRMDRAFFSEHPMPRMGILDALKHDVESKRYRGDKRPVLLSFTSDPYQPIEEHFQLTRRAIEILGEAGFKIRVLTKNAPLALRDFDLFKKYGVEFGQTIIFTDDMFRRHYEPHASTVHARVTALQFAHEKGISTWVSIEPVIDPVQVLAVLDYHVSVDTFKIGKLNHDKEREAEIDWSGFLRNCLERLHAPDVKSNYLIKNALWEHATSYIRQRFTKERAL